MARAIIRPPLYRGRHITMDLTTYLSQLEGNYRLFDVGRRIRKLDKKQFHQVESLSIPYPTPYQHHAWLALYISQPHQPENETLWFLKWPLDEQGFLIPYVRDDLVNRFLSLSDKPLKADTQLEDPLKDNPFSFKPDDLRRANLHSLIQMYQHRKPSSQFDAVLHYLQDGNLNSASLANWNSLGIQGIADFSARLKEFPQTLLGCVDKLPAEPYLAFSQCLEHHNTSHGLSDIVLTRFLKDLEQPERSAAVEAGMRIIGASQDDHIRIQAWRAWFESPYCKEIQSVLVFSTRNYDDLALIPEVFPNFLHILASIGENFNVFIKVMNDLLFLPGLRNILLSSLRAPDCNGEVRHALQALMNQQQN